MLSFESPDFVNGSVCDHTLCRITDERFPSPWLSMAGRASLLPIKQGPRNLVSVGVNRFPQVRRGISFEGVLYTTA